MKKIIRKYVPLDLLKILYKVKWEIKNILLGLEYPKKIIGYTEKNVKILKEKYGELTKFKIKEITTNNKHIKYSSFVNTIGEKILTIPSPPSKNNKQKICLTDSRDSQFSLRNNFLLTPDLSVFFYDSVSFQAICDITGGALENPKKIKGTVASIANGSFPNIFTWLFFSIPSIDVYQKCDLTKEIDYYYIGKKDLTEYEKKTLELAGIPLSKVINYGVTADRLLMTLGVGGISPFTVNYIRSIANNQIKKLEITKRNRLIYITRGDETSYRKLINESEILPILNNYGFEIVTINGSMSLEEQAFLFNSAQIIVAIHGAALTNLIFCQENVTIFELFPSKYHTANYMKICCLLGFSYFYLFGEYNDDLIKDYPSLDLEGNKPDLYIDVNKFRTLLDNIMIKVNL